MKAIRRWLRAWRIRRATQREMDLAMELMAERDARRRLQGEYCALQDNFDQLLRRHLQTVEDWAWLKSTVESEGRQLGGDDLAPSTPAVRERRTLAVPRGARG